MVDVGRARKDAGEQIGRFLIAADFSLPKMNVSTTVWMIIPLVMSKSESKEELTDCVPRIIVEGTEDVRCILLPFVCPEVPFSGVLF